MNSSILSCFVVNIQSSAFDIKLLSMRKYFECFVLTVVTTTSFTMETQWSHSPIWYIQTNLHKFEIFIDYFKLSIFLFFFHFSEYTSFVPINTSLSNSNLFSCWDFDANVCCTMKAIQSYFNGKEKLCHGNVTFSFF